MITLTLEHLNMLSVEIVTPRGVYITKFRKETAILLKDSIHERIEVILSP